MITPENVTDLFQQIYEAEKSCASAAERERKALIAYETATMERKDADETRAHLLERMQTFARKAAGVSEPEPEERPQRNEYTPFLRGRRY